jgi:hypothetical protein
MGPPRDRLNVELACSAFIEGRLEADWALEVWWIEESGESWDARWLRFGGCG